MNAPVIWIIFPILSAILLYLFRQYSRLVKIIGILICLFLALLAWQLPIGSPISLGPWPSLPAVTLSETLTVFGRQFILNDSSRSFLLIIYLGTASWVIGASVINVSRLFIPVSLLIAGLLTAAISVEPFLYAAFFIQITILSCVPLLSPPGIRTPRGALRFLIFQTIGMILLIFSGWSVTNVELNAINPTIVYRTTIILILGFAMTISVFPFSTWIPMVLEETNPYMAAFVIFTLPEIVSLFAFNTFSRYSWLYTSLTIQISFIVIGLVMVVGSGIWAIFQNNLGRIFGYAVIIEIGLFLITLGQELANIQGNQPEAANLIAQLPLAAFFFALLLPRGLTLALWAFSLALIKIKSNQLDFKSTQGIGFTFPVAGLSLIVASLSLAGFPLLSGYPIRAVVGASLSQTSIILALSTLIGYFGLVLATLRSISNLYTNPDKQAWKISETRPQLILLISGCLIIFFVGMFPQVFLYGLEAIFP